MTEGDDSADIPKSKWLFSSSQLHQCRARANREGREYLQSLVAKSTAAAATGTSSRSHEEQPTRPVKWFASGYSKRCNDDDDASAEDSNLLPSPPLTPPEELLLVQFYSGKIPDLIGPAAMLSRLRRDVKVTATASALFRRFFLSNSVMLHDPKAIMVASAFLGSKVEDATVDIRYLEEATKQMQAPVTQKEIVEAEVSLVAGLHFELLCFHPYKTVLAYTEDLRTYLKTDKGRSLATFSGNEDRPVVGEDLRPMHDDARKIVDDACVSDVILLAPPGQIGLAAMMVANEDLLLLQQKQLQELQQPSNGEDGDDVQPKRPTAPKIDLLGYAVSRFDDRGNEDYTGLRSRINDVCDMLRALREGKYVCGNHGIDMVKLKAVHKKLKKCRGGAENKSKKKKKKRQAGTDGEDATAASGSTTKKSKAR